jgi:hypothetical protein
VPKSKQGVRASICTHFPYACFGVSKTYLTSEMEVPAAVLLTIPVFWNVTSRLLINSIHNCGPRNPWMRDYLTLNLKALRTLNFGNLLLIDTA